MSETVSVTVRLPKELVSAVDALGVSRTSSIRKAIERMMYADGSPLPSMKPSAPFRKAAVKTEVEHRPDGSVLREQPAKRSHPDDAIVLDAIRSGRWGSRDLKAHLGWLGIRYEKAERRLLSDRRVEIRAGYLVAV